MADELADHESRLASVEGKLTVPIWVVGINAVRSRVWQLASTTGEASTEWGGGRPKARRAEFNKAYRDNLWLPSARYNVAADGNGLP